MLNSTNRRALLQTSVMTGGPVAANGHSPQLIHLTQADLATRWRISERTLERWRSANRGPVHLKVGSRAIYRLADIEAYEAENLRAPQVRQLRNLP